MKTWREIGFEIEPTRDGSPTLHLLEANQAHKEHGESMHHSAGAASETLLIYGKPIAECLKAITKPSFLIVGLGLGYIEMTLALCALQLGKKPEEVSLITSCESVPELRQYFFAWIHNLALAEEVQNTYDLAAQSLCVNTSVNNEELKQFLRPHFLQEKDMYGALLPESILPARYHGILYDAFSSKTTPQLWEDSFFAQIFLNSSEPDCFLSTYSGKGSLRTVLKAHGFDVVIREGFYGKRTSTLGLRGVLRKM